MSRVPRLRNTVWVFRVLFELVLKDEWSVLGSSQGRSLCSKVSLHPYFGGPWRGQDWEELRLWVWGDGQLRMGGVPGWLQSWLQVALAPTMMHLRGPWAGECVFSFWWQLRRENWGLHYSLGPKKGGWSAWQGKTRAWKIPTRRSDFTWACGLQLCVRCQTAEYLETFRCQLFH